MPHQKPQTRASMPITQTDCVPREVVEQIARIIRCKEAAVKSEQESKDITAKIAETELPKYMDRLEKDMASHLSRFREILGDRLQEALDPEAKEARMELTEKLVTLREDAIVKDLIELVQSFQGTLVDVKD